MQLGRVWREPFHCLEPSAVSLDREEQARTYRFTVQQNGAGAADAVFAAHVGPREPQIITNKIHQKSTRFRLAPVLASIDCYANVSFAHAVLRKSHT
jgi:hypothetical protein